MGALMTISSGWGELRARNPSSKRCYEKADSCLYPYFSPLRVQWPAGVDPLFRDHSTHAARTTTQYGNAFFAGTDSYTGSLCPQYPAAHNLAGERNAASDRYTVPNFHANGPPDDYTGTDRSESVYPVAKFVPDGPAFYQSAC